MNSKYIFLDIDGTLVDFDGVLADSALTALKTAQRNGHKLFVCTGRQRTQVYSWLLEKVEFDGIIASSGAYVEADGKIIAEHCFDSERMSFLAKYFNGSNTPFCVQCADELVLEKWTAEAIGKYFSAKGIDGTKQSSLFGTVKTVESAAQLTAGEKIVYYSAPKSTSGVAADLGDRFNVVRFSFGNAADDCGEVTDSRYTKATGIAEILGYFNASKQDTVAVGDGDNDLEMMDFAALGISMGNGTPALKAVADIITDDINSNGLYNAFKKIGVI